MEQLAKQYARDKFRSNSIMPPPLHKKRTIAINLKWVHPATTVFVLYRRQIFDYIATSDELNFSRVTKPIGAITQIHFFHNYHYSLL